MLQDSLGGDEDAGAYDVPCGGDGEASAFPVGLWALHEDGKPGCCLEEEKGEPEARMSLGPSRPAAPLWADDVLSLVPGMAVGPCPCSQAPLPEMVLLLCSSPTPTYSQEGGQAQRLSHLSNGRVGATPVHSTHRAQVSASTPAEASSFFKPRHLSDFQSAGQSWPLKASP